MDVNYKEHQKRVGNKKSFEILGYLFFIIGIFIVVKNIASAIEWNKKEDNYIKQYVFSEAGKLYYEEDEEKVYVKKIYDTDGDKIMLDIPNNKTIVMYIDKNNINEGIYLDLNNSKDQNILNPTFGIFISFLIVVLGLYLILTAKETKEGKVTTKPTFGLFVFLFAVGIALIIWQIINAINYFDLKNNNNITTATICSEIYSTGTKNNLYKPVSYYHVDNKKYIYVNDLYVDGTLEENLGKTFKLYYDEKNPSIVSKEEESISVGMLVIGIAFVVIGFPFVFFKKKMEEAVQKGVAMQKSGEIE